MLALNSLLHNWKNEKHKMLNIIELYCKESSFSYLRLDGKCTVSLRQGLVDKFNNDSTIFIFLLTTKVGGVGISLVGADRVIIYDPDWNPSTDTQAKERAWRIGQTREVVIYRLLTSGTIEDKMFNRQIFKIFLADKVLENSAQTKTKINLNDIHDLFSYSESNIKSSSSTLSDKIIDYSSILLPTTIKKRKYKWRKQEEISEDDNITPFLIKKQHIIDKIKKFDDQKNELTNAQLIKDQAEQISTKAIYTMGKYASQSFPLIISNNKNSAARCILDSLKATETPTPSILSYERLDESELTSNLKDFFRCNNYSATSKEIAKFCLEMKKKEIDISMFNKIIRRIANGVINENMSIKTWFLKKKFR
ncbi:hypothetical protein HZS_293 [Henneguya salminicola]|nr:hypothetical protein HZS_293 [Henneguya salminicola]